MKHTLWIPCLALSLIACDGALDSRALDEPGTADPSSPNPDRPVIPGADMGDLTDSGAPLNPIEPGEPRPMPPGGGAVLRGHPNTLDAERLFVCTDEIKGATPARLWRISPEQYEQASRQVKRTTNHPAENPFAGANTSWRFQNPADEFTVEEAAVDALFRGPRKVIQVTLGDNKISGCIRTAYKDNTNPTPECQRSAIDFVGNTLFRRPLTDEERTRYQTRMAALIAQSNPKRGIEAGLMLMFTAPEFLFRDELGGELAPDGRRRLTSTQLMGALAFALSDATPDAGLLNAASQDKLQTSAQISAQVRRILGADGANIAPVRRFMREFFHYHEAPNIFKERSLTAGWRPDDMVATTDRFVTQVLKDDQDVLARLLTSDLFVQKNGDLTTDSKRVGLLSHESWLVAFSQNSYNDPIKRGKFIRESLMAQHIPEIPIGVVPQLPPQRDDQTMRDRLGEHVANPGCETCHKMMDPLGLTFERFEHHGEWRELEAGQPVDTSGEIFFGGALDGPVKDHVELMTKLASSTLVERSFIRHLFRFVMGRDETYNDACSLSQMHDAYKMSGGSLAATLEALILSDSFLYRIDAQPADPKEMP